MPSLNYTDEQLRAAVEKADTWSAVRVALGGRRSGNCDSIKRRCRLLGLSVGHIGGPRAEQLPSDLALPLPFSRNESDANLQDEAISCAVGWFTRRGYVVSLPLQVCSYDLVVESDEGLKRVQVKTSRSRTAQDNFYVRLRKTMYRRTTEGSQWKAEQVPYEAQDLDYFFIVTAERACYLVPFAVVQGRAAVTLGSKYDQYRVA